MLHKQNATIRDVNNKVFKQKMKYAWLNMKHLSGVFLVLFIGYTVILGLTVLIN